MNILSIWGINPCKVHAPLQLFYSRPPAIPNQGAEKVREMNPHYRVILFWIIVAGGRGFWVLCVIARGLLGEFVIEPSVYSTVKPNTVGWKIQFGGSEMPG